MRERPGPMELNIENSPARNSGYSCIACSCFAEAGKRGQENGRKGMGANYDDVGKSRREREKREKRREFPYDRSFGITKLNEAGWSSLWRRRRGRNIGGGGGDLIEMSAAIEFFN